MSRQPSPGPSQSSFGHTGILEQTMSANAGREPTFIVGPQPGLPPAPSGSGRTKSKAYSSGIAAGVEDVKYAAKYRDLKRKVKDIELDNDKLLFKVLQAKRNIQRAKLERAILYERLGTVPASPPRNAAALPPQVQGVHGHHGPPNVSPPGMHPVPSAHAPRHGHSHTLPAQEPHALSRIPHHHPQGPHELALPVHSGRHHREHARDREMPYPIRPAPGPPSATEAPHQGQLPITHAPQVCTVQTIEGPMVVVAGPDGRPVYTAEGTVIPAGEVHGSPSGPTPPSAPAPRRRGGRQSARAREEAAATVAHLEQQFTAQGPVQTSPTLPHAHGHGGVLLAPMTRREQREREREQQAEWEQEREMRERERERVEAREIRERERAERHAHGHSHSLGHVHGHPHAHNLPETLPPPPTLERERSRRHDIHELAGSPPPMPPPLSIQTQAPIPPGLSSPGQHAHRGHSHHSHHSHSQSRHSHSHSNSPHSPSDGRSYPITRIHAHQRMGPGTNINRDWEQREVERKAEEQRDAQAGHDASSSSATPAPTPASGSGGLSVDVASKSSNPSRVPTPPYMQRSSQPKGEDVEMDLDAAQATADSRASENGAGTASERGASATPP